LSAAVTVGKSAKLLTLLYVVPAYSRKLAQTEQKASIAVIAGDGVSSRQSQDPAIFEDMFSGIAAKQQLTFRALVDGQNEHESPL
jgi:hypothetical protein